MRRALVAIAAALLRGADPTGEVWHFDSLTQLGGHAVTVAGHPRVISTPAGTFTWTQTGDSHQLPNSQSCLQGIG